MDAIDLKCCSRRSCKWVGTEAEMRERRDSSVLTTLVCPLCGCESFYKAKAAQIDRYKKVRTYKFT